MWKRIIGAIGGTPSGKIVGRDDVGNVFRLSAEGKRSVDFIGGIHNIDLHPAWRAWLSGQREDPPTAQEIEKRKRDMVTLKENVKKLEMEDAKLRVQEQMNRDRGDHD